MQPSDSHHLAGMVFGSGWNLEASTQASSDFGQGFLGTRRAGRRSGACPRFPMDLWSIIETEGMELSARPSQSRTGRSENSPWEGILTRAKATFELEIVHLVASRNVLEEETRGKDPKDPSILVFVSDRTE